MKDFPLKVQILGKVQLKEDKNFLVQEKGDFIFLYTHYSHVVDYFKKFLKQERVDFKIYIKDDSRFLDQVYEADQYGYYRIPNSKWHSKLYSNYKKLIAESSKNQEVEILETTKGGVPRFSEKELHNQLLSDGWIYENQVPGSFLYGPKYVELEKAIIKLYEDSVLKRKGVEYKFSNLIPIQDLIRSDYLQTCGPQLYYIVKTTGDTKKLIVKSKLEEYLSPLEILEHTTGVHYAMNYCSCHGLWASFRNHNFVDPVIWFYDNSVPTYRNEKGKIRSLERLEIFNRMETVFLSSKDIEPTISELKENLKEFYKLCNIGISIQKKGNWIREEGSNLGYTLDYMFYGLDHPLEVGNLSYNSTHWTKVYNITHKNKQAHSGCTGIGLQRIIYLFLLINGFDIVDWPDAIRKLI